MPSRGQNQLPPNALEKYTGLASQMNRVANRGNPPAKIANKHPIVFSSLLIFLLIDSSRTIREIFLNPKLAVLDLSGREQKPPVGVRMNVLTDRWKTVCEKFAYKPVLLQPEHYRLYPINPPRPLPASMAPNTRNTTIITVALLVCSQAFQPSRVLAAASPAIRK